MQCPNCQLNIKDDATFCIHCGTRFENVVVSEPQLDPNNQQQVQTNNVGNQVNNNTNNQSVTTTVQRQLIPIKQEKGIDKTKYMEAYFGREYLSIMRCAFSWGTFLLGPIWLLVCGLYSAAFKLFFTDVGIWGGLFIINILFLSMGLNITRLLSVILLVAVLYVRYKFATETSNMRYSKADFEIDTILGITEDEEERLKLCKRGVVARSAIKYAVVLIAILLPGFFIYVSVRSVLESRQRTAQDSFMITAKQYANEAKTQVMASNISCKSSPNAATFDVDPSKVNSGKFFIPISTDTNWKAKLNTDITGSPIDNAGLLVYNGKSPWKNSYLYGVVAFDITSVDAARDVLYNKNFYVTMIDSTGHGIPSNVIGVTNYGSLKRDNVLLKDAKIDVNDFKDYLECKVIN